MKKKKGIGALTREKSKCYNRNTRKCRKVHKSESLTYSQREKEIERGYEEEREISHVPIFPPPSFKILRMLAGWMGIWSKDSVLWGNMVGFFSWK